ncbi:MAG TPA: UDP-N-acetylmuramate--L-alanine ligase [Candidatus Hydrogenedentes bacterium]|jgi:UDP-N-acetylmuramate--alanine ligase|nr:UDP-N-acetylmuramate--L-alanine ligase [Candidatus Hydrogenedentota bacterium]
MQAVNGPRRKVHFIGVGGIGMSGLAEILLNLGYELSGSDVQHSSIVQRLEQFGLTFHRGHAAEHLGDAEIVVVSAAISEDNAEIVAARQRGIPVLHRSELLADLIRLKPHAVVVAGTHGKTTTTSMISAFLDSANIGATTIVGGILHRSGTNARWGAGDYLVAEADEHDGSFLKLHPTVAVVTSIDAEHLEYYGTLDRIKRAFVDFCNRVPFYGQSILCGDDLNCRDILPEIEGVTLTYGLNEDAALQGVNIRKGSVAEKKFGDGGMSPFRTLFDVISHDNRFGQEGFLGTVEIQAVGRHNIQNALAACSVGLCLGMRFAAVAAGLRQFDGVRRRLQWRGTAAGVQVIEDYAHHPTEIASTLEAARWLEPKRIVCVFQPHLYSRTKFFCEDFARILAQADRALVTDIYPSREQPMPGVDAGLIVDAACALGASHVELVRDMHAVPAEIARFATAGDMVLVLGAGDVNCIAPAILESLEGVEKERGYGRT